ncbi:MAG: hypothetical protein WCP22_03405 [Chlamydiota bacterium]
MHGWLRRRKGMLLLGLSVWLSAAPSEAAIRVDSFLSLVREGKTYDGKEIEIEGEAVGDVMMRGSYAWVNVRSPEDVALGIILAPEQARRIRQTGDYFHAGDRIRVTGTFRRFAAAYGGETCVVAREMTVARSGFATPHPVSRRKITAALALIAFSILLLIALAVKCRATCRPIGVLSRVREEGGDGVPLHRGGHSAGTALNPRTSTMRRDKP